MLLSSLQISFFCKSSKEPLIAFHQNKVTMQETKTSPNRSDRGYAHAEFNPPPLKRHMYRASSTVSRPSRADTRKGKAGASVHAQWTARRSRAGLVAEMIWFSNLRVHSYLRRDICSSPFLGAIHISCSSSHSPQATHAALTQHVT